MRLFFYPLGFDHGGKAARYARQYRAVAFGQFYLFPVLFYLFAVPGCGLSVNVRMAAYQLFAFGIEDFGHGERAVFASHYGVKYQVEHYVSRLFFYAVHIAVQYGVA